MINFADWGMEEREGAGITSYSSPSFSAAGPPKERVGEKRKSAEPFSSSFLSTGRAEM